MNERFGVRDAIRTLSGKPDRVWPAGVLHHGSRALLLVLLAFFAQLLFPVAPVPDFPVLEIGMVAEEDVIAQVGFPTMELPILYALTHPTRLPDQGIRRYDPVAAGSLTFEPVRSDVFRAFHLGVEAGRAGGTAPAAFNAANEEAVAAFLAGGLRFGRISEVIDAVLSQHVPGPARDVETVRARRLERTRHVLARNVGAPFRDHGIAQHDSHGGGMASRRIVSPSLDALDRNVLDVTGHAAAPAPGDYVRPNIARSIKQLQ